MSTAENHKRRLYLLRWRTPGGSERVLRVALLVNDINKICL